MIRLATADEIAQRVALPDAVELVLPDFDPADYVGLTDERNIVLTTEWADKIYEIHWLLTDRGRVAINSGIDFLRYLFNESHARVVVGQTPAHKRAARWFSRQVGVRSQGLIRTALGDMELFAMTRQEFEAQHEFPYGKAGKQQESSVSVATV